MLTEKRKQLLKIIIEQGSLSMLQMQEATGRKRANIIESITWLEKNGYLKVHRQSGFKNTYHVPVEIMKKVIDTCMA